MACPLYSPTGPNRTRQVSPIPRRPPSVGVLSASNSSTNMIPSCGETQVGCQEDHRRRRVPLSNISQGSACHPYRGWTMTTQLILTTPGADIRLQRTSGSNSKGLRIWYLPAHLLDDMADMHLAVNALFMGASIIIMLQAIARHECVGLHVNVSLCSLIRGG
ncbi:hypothetical protein MAPG_10605 [Magnaporthiopsis poae ATCC 64411]|uniref:Uncharacterized protein n=1 Tax=Magnaporthiopsis poae (strain ATCC 64411 / 73-15) TaxID=644358 RepID=A0A0C4ED14_MAGP6|nr:hypothetical protein MAPG_10605 [Magnaporthiopsis poae ATCC 64411]